MARRMTCADRVPEPGDVVYSLNGHTYRIAAHRYWGKTVKEVKPRWRYISRADGGPVEVEEQTETSLLSAPWLKEGE